MYLQFHKLKMLPFENTPDPRFFYPSEDHREALANLAYAARSQKGMVLITGDVGMGKTTTSFFLEEKIGGSAKLIAIRTVPSTPKELLWYVADGLGLNPKASLTRGEMFRMIRIALLQLTQRGQTALVMIDEAQALPLPVLNEVRLLSNLETTTRKLCQILLIGQTEIREMLQSPQLEALRQRIVLSHHIHPLSLEDTQRYLVVRLTRASADPTPAVSFTEDAMRRLHRLTGGVIRRINVLADKALLVASVRGSNKVDVDHITEASRSVVGTPAVAGTVTPPDEAPTKKAA